MKVIVSVFILALVHIAPAQESDTDIMDDPNPADIVDEFEQEIGIRKFFESVYEHYDYDEMFGPVQFYIENPEAELEGLCEEIHSNCLEEKAPTDSYEGTFLCFLTYSYCNEVVPVFYEEST